MATCIHGFDQGQCLICQTLATGPGAAKTTQVAEAEPRRSSRRHRATASPVEVVDDRAPETSHGGSAITHILIAVVLVIVALVAFWAVAGIVFALFRLLEIVIVGAAAGVLGYRLGRARGHRDR